MHLAKRFVSLALIAIVLVASVAIPRGQADAAPGDEVGVVQVNTSTSNTCNLIVNAGNPAAEKMDFTVKPPAVFASKLWNQANPGLKQPVRLYVYYAYLDNTGKVFNQGTVIQIDGTAGFSSQPATFPANPTISKSLEPTHVWQINYQVQWLTADKSGVTGSKRFVQTVFRKVNGGALSATAAETCAPPPVDLLSVNKTVVTVNENVQIDVRYGHVTGDSFTYGTAVLFDGKVAPTLLLPKPNFSTYRATFKVPAAPKGTRILKIQRIDGTSETFTMTVKPRIKVPNPTVVRGFQYEISLRGFTANESIKIRWQKPNGSWVQVGTATTSSTGSANPIIEVPTWAADGLHKVRADGATSSAQTNTVNVSGGTFIPAAVKKSPSPTATATPEPTATQTPVATVTEETTPEPTPIATVDTTPEPTTEPTVEPVPTEEPALDPTPEPTVEPTSTEPALEPTASIEPTVEATAEATT